MQNSAPTGEAKAHCSTRLRAGNGRSACLLDTHAARMKTFPPGATFFGRLSPQGTLRVIFRIAANLVLEQVSCRTRAF
jgi:hypothetical protein